MSHDDDTHADGSSDRGVEVEKWILRSLLLGLAGALLAAIAASIDDIQRYVRIKQM